MYGKLNSLDYLHIVSIFPYYFVTSVCTKSFVDRIFLYGSTPNILHNFRVCSLYIDRKVKPHSKFLKFDSKSYRTNEYCVYLCASMWVLFEKQMIDYKVCDQAPSRNESRNHDATLLSMF